VARIAAQVAISLGSNLGDRRGHLEFAIERLRQLLDDVRASAIRETEPVEVTDRQPSYLNAAVIGITTLEPHELLSELLTIEALRGRTRPAPRAPRTLDLDLILYGDRVIETDRLTVPHPRFRERPFVLEPLAEVAPAMPDPITRRTVSELLAEALERDEKTRE
jgi:2-amino-4-hydroxy-6-hydroxymethyldihydropteridine diphosphokinase